MRRTRVANDILNVGAMTRLALFLLALPAIAKYAVRTGEVVQLEDTDRQTVVSIVPSIGNIVFEMKVKGQNLLRFPYASIEDFRAKPALCGIPLLAPWANRLDETAFYANGKKYEFQMNLGNVRGPIPIHGFVMYAPQWRVIEAKADAKGAWLTSQLEFYKQPDWMAQFPFAHTIRITDRLENGVLEVRTQIDNLSSEPMPVAIGFHPYFQLGDSPRDEWKISVGARKEWLLAPNKIPTGETRPIERLFPDPRNVALKDYDIDHAFGDLVRDASGRATMSVLGKSQKIEVLFGEHYHATIIYAPKGQDRNFICFEPMAAITDAMNLAHRNLYSELESIPPGKAWQESFWIRPTGF